MAEVDRLFDEFVAQHRAGSEPDPHAFLDRVTGTDRAELAALIDGYLARAPRREWDPEAFAASPAREVTEALLRSLSGASGAWPLLLPRLRSRAKLRREEVVGRLARALGVADRDEKVAAYYHRMEQGTLAAAGVSGAVLEALAEVIGTSADVLRGAGEALDPTGRAEAADPVFTRLARDELDTLVPEAEADSQDAGAAGAPARDAGERDEVDELFTGG